MIVPALLVGCGITRPTPVPVPLAANATPASATVPAEASATPTPIEDEAVAATLGSLEQVDDYPLYTMHYYGAYDQRAFSAAGVRWAVSAGRSWGCSLFAALGDAGQMYYGRNFDWEYSPALLLFTDPPDGHASVSMVDIAYLGFGGDEAGTLLDLPLAERRALLDAPFLPFDGMNEHGLAVGMAAVSPGQMQPDPNKETIGSLGVIREMLDHAADVDEAVAILRSYNVDMGDGPPLHYLVADSSGRSALVEFYQGEMAVIPNEDGTDWHLATNFLRASVGESAEGQCWRYDRISQRLAEAEGRMTAQDAVDLLAEVAQEITQWSIVYGISNGDVNVAMGQKYDDVHTLYLRLGEVRSSRIACNLRLPSGGPAAGSGDPFRAKSRTTLKRGTTKDCNREKVLQKTNRERHTLILELLVLALLATACGNSATPGSPARTPVGGAAPSERTSDEGLPAGALPEFVLGETEGLGISSGQRVKFEHISVEHGLSQSSVNCILQDSGGFIWFGTDNGLNKYDGYSFTVYKSDPARAHSLSYNTVTSVVEDQQGALWVGTQHGLNRFDRETGRFIHYQADPENRHSLISSEIMALLEDRSGVLWVGTGDGLDRFDRETDRFVHYQADPDNPDSLRDDRITAIYEDRAGVLWVGTWGGLAWWDRETERFTHYQFAPKDATRLGHNAVQSISEDQAGGLWIGTGGSGFYRLDRETGRFSQYFVTPGDVEGLAYNSVESVYEDQAGVLWIGTGGGGLYQFDREEGRLISYQMDPHDANSLSSNYITSIYEGQTGVLWIGTWGGGINKLDRGKERFTLYQTDPRDPNSLSHNRVLALYEDREGILWIGTDGGGLDGFDRERGVFTRYRHDPSDPDSLSNNYVASICQDRDGDLWIGTWGGGLDRFDRENGRFIHYEVDPSDPYSLSSDVIMSVHQDREGVLWIGTSEGLERLDRKNARFIHHPGLRQAVWSIYEDREGVLWFGTDYGLGKYDREDGRLLRYRADSQDSNSLSHNAVYAIHQDQNGVLWIGTREGLNKFDPATEIFVHYREKDGLPSDLIYGILEDDRGYLWLSTTGGLSRFDPRTETFKNYDVSDGLQGYEFTRAHYRCQSGEMFFGGINGFNAFHPDLVTDNPFIPPVVLTSLTQDGVSIFDVGRAVESVEQAAIHWPNNFEFEFAALSYRQPERNQYAYMLEGFDKDWNYAGTRRFGKYTNLPGGTFKLRIKGSNNDGVWNEEGVSIEITVVPPFWATWWFRGIALLALVGSAIGGYRLRVRRIETRSDELETQVRERTYEIEQRRQELEALYRADVELYRYLDLDRVLQALVDIAVDILQADKSSVLVWDKEQERLVMRIARGFSSEAMARLSFAQGKGVVGRVAASGAPAIVEDVLADPRREDESPEVVQAVLSEGIRSSMHLPIKIGGELFGVFSVSFTEPRAFDKDEQRLFMALAQRAALAIENVRLYEQTQEMAVVEERNRLARDLHDAVTQTLFSASLIAETLPALWESDQDEGRQLLEDLRRLSRGALAEMRTLLLELRPTVLTEADLGHLLRQLGEAITGRRDVPVTVVVKGQYDLPDDVHVALYRIAQEALNNVVKHARAGQVTMSLRYLPCTEGAVELRVSDDGCGFDPSDVPPGCLGLSIMRERVQTIGATLAVESEVGRGTEIVVVWSNAAEQGAA
jgi:ligand-binding sensor domain-containing protein/signal transduction histidine kinase